MSKLFDKAAVAVKKRNYDYAIELFLQELTRNPDSGEARRALRAAELKKFQEAGASPSSPAAYLKGIGPWFGAHLQKITKNYEKSMLSCEQFLKFAPRSTSMLGLLGDMARAAGHSQAAKVVFEDLLDADRSSQRALRNLGQLYREDEDLGAALTYYEKLKKLSPSDPEAAKAVRDLAASSVSRRVEDRRKEGDGSYRDMVKSGADAKKSATRGKKARTSEEIDDQIADLEDELDGSREDVRRLKVIGDLYLRKKAFGEAVASYEKALEIKKDAQVADALGDAKLKRLDHMLQSFALKAKKGDKNALKMARKIKKERLTTAIAEYERRVKARPTELSLKFQLGSQLVKAKRYDDAITHLQRATGDPRRGVHARTLLGKCFAAKGMTDLAVKEFRKALDKSQGNEDTTKDIRYSLAAVLANGGKKDDAAAEYERIIEVDIGYKDAMKRLEALQA